VTAAACLLKGQLACLQGSLPAYKAACLLTRQLACLQGRGGGRGCTPVHGDFMCMLGMIFSSIAWTHKLTLFIFLSILIMMGGVLTLLLNLFTLR
jgi:hypothetical protein